MNQPEPNTRAEWRRQHRTGTPSILMMDAELRAYVDRRILELPFYKLAAELRETFGPERAVSKSSIARYWSRNKTRLLNPDTN